MFVIGFSKGLNLYIDETQASTAYLQLASDIFDCLQFASMLVSTYEQAGSTRQTVRLPGQLRGAKTWGLMVARYFTRHYLLGEAHVRRLFEIGRADRNQHPC